MTYTDAVARLEKSGQTFEHPVSWGLPLQTEHERYLTETLLKKPVILTDYPKDMTAFYMRLNDDEKTVRAMDVLVPQIGEIHPRREPARGAVRRARRAAEGPGDEAGGLRVVPRAAQVRHGSALRVRAGLRAAGAVLHGRGSEHPRDVIPCPRTPGHAEF